VISNFITQAIKGKPLTIYGDGKQTRSFCYVDDLIDGMIRTMEYASKLPGPVNLGNPVEYSMLQLAEKIIELTGSKSRTVHEPLPTDDPKQRCPDITRATTLLGWSPRFPLDVGLKNTIAYYRDLLSQETA
jgi:UDP-glucuronate decarboxylase